MKKLIVIILLAIGFSFTQQMPKANAYFQTPQDTITSSIGGLRKDAGNFLPFGSFRCFKSATNKVQFYSTGNDIKYWLITTPAVLDSVVYSTPSELINKISSFKRGGGDGSGVTESQLNALLSGKADKVNGKVPESQLPSYIDNVQEYDSLAVLPDLGLDNVIYLTKDENKVYRWSGTGYIEIAQTISLGETSSTAYRGDHGLWSYNHSYRVDNPHGVTASQVGLGNVNNTSDANKPISNDAQAALNSKQNISEKGQSNGYAPLDASGLIPLQHLNVSGLSFKGAWNALTNTPALLNGIGNVGDFYKVGVPGTYNFGNGEFTFVEGDWVIFAAGVWQRLGSTEIVSAVNGKIGMVNITKSDIGLGNVDNTSSAQLRDRSTHTGTQDMATITGLSDILDELGENSNVVLSTTTSDNVTTREYNDRFEYTTKISISRTVGGNAYDSFVSTSVLPIGVTIDSCDEHYISIKNNQRTITINIYDNSQRRILVAYKNHWGESQTCSGTAFIKLVKYK